jgi:hypothetical protein
MIYTQIPQIKWPIYRLPSNEWNIQDGLVLLEHQILDDRNMPSDKLGVRRLLTPQKPLFPLKRGLTAIPGLLKYRHYIDSSGHLFSYEKTKLCDLRCYRIKRVELKETYSLIWLIGLSIPMIVNRPPPIELPYARVLCLGKHPWVIYDYVSESHKDTRRKI